MIERFYSTWVFMLAPCYCATGAYLVSVLCRAFRSSRSAALWPIPLLGLIGCVATGFFFAVLLGPGLRWIDIDTPASDAWARSQFREAAVMAFVPAAVVVWHQIRQQITMHPRPGRGTYAAVLDSAPLQYGFIFLVQLFITVQAFSWPMIKRINPWVPEWWQSEALAWLGWMLILLAHRVGPLVVLAVGFPHIALLLWRRWRARVRRTAGAPLQSFG
jgi:hypothetical protein